MKKIRNCEKKPVAISAKSIAIIRAVITYITTAKFFSWPRIVSSFALA